MEFVDQAVAYMRDGFGIVNGDWRNLVLALIAAIFMGGWKQWLPFAALAVVAHIAIQKLAPVLAGDGEALSLPPIMETQFWIEAGVLLLGYLITIGVFFLIKSLIFRKSAAAH
ncbi:MAG: hypothetical protein J0L81_18075 [Caulobacterales bacterium]|nr:hypothetical protein [Caulobacterales bacterium]